MSRLGLGGTALSGEKPFTDPDQTASESQAIELIRRSLALGLSYFDSAPVYGLGESERRYGRALTGVPRDSYVVSTKVGRLLHPPDTDVRWKFDFSREGVLTSFYSSLERLGLEYVDIVYIHDPDDHYEQALKESLPTLHELRAAGQIKAIGVGMHPWETQLQFARDGEFDCFLIVGRYTLLNQTALPEFLPYCLEHNISVVAGAPYNSGILAAGPRAGVTFNYEAAPAQILEKAQRISDVCKRYDVPLKAAALQFILAHPAIASVIPGARSAAEVEDNFRMVEFPIPPALWTDLRNAGLIPEKAPVPAGP